ncbi:hypothetical protein ACFZBU_43210 [Embleya sp. NPDC008237]|uniref:hypothetical protein n=1 Tax=Embleya sp. NPDC008237 TaxID=3363978 RepID=UPI0036EB38DA
MNTTTTAVIACALLVVVLAMSMSWVGVLIGLAPLVVLGGRELYGRYLVARTERAKK